MRIWIEPCRACGAPAHGCRSRERAAGGERRTARRPHRVEAARIHAAHSDAPQDGGRFPSARRRARRRRLARTARRGDKVEVASEDDRGFAHSDGLPSVNLAVIPQSKANVLDVARGVRAEMQRIEATLPADITMSINVDFSIFVSASMHEVRFTLALALTMVLIVIFGFLGSWRATLIPALTIPVSIVASAMVMAATRLLDQRADAARRRACDRPRRG